MPTEQGADARALGVDLALACSAELLLVSVVAALWIEACWPADRVHPWSTVADAIVPHRP